MPAIYYSMQKSPVLKASGLAPIDDEPVHVFGRNLEERVVESKGDDANNKEDEEKRSKGGEGDRTTQEDDVETIKKMKFDAITGEEDEETVFQGDFKLFQWELGSSNWIEKGRGQLKLNDLVKSNEKRFRLIMRTGGTYRIILNVAIKHSFFKVISSAKTTIRFTDSIHVWAASGSNAEQLADLIKERLEESAKDAETSTREIQATTEETEPSFEDNQPTSEVSEPETDDTKLRSEDRESSAEDTKFKAEDSISATEDAKSATINLKSKDISIKSTAEGSAAVDSDPLKEYNTSSGEGIKPASESDQPTSDRSKSPAILVSQSGRRHSHQSDESNEGEVGTKKLKSSSD